MINYSIVMPSVNANLLEINQAKKDGKEPEKKDRSPLPHEEAVIFRFGKAH